MDDVAVALIEDADFIRWALSQGIAAVYLHGSTARGTSRPDSDVDIALLMELNPASWHDAECIREEAVAQLSRVLCVPQSLVDVQFMNEAPPAFQYRVLQARHPLWESDKKLRVAYEALLMSEYLDYRYYEDMHYDAMRRRLKEGTYGRGPQPAPPSATRH